MTVTKNGISPLLVRLFSKIRMLGEATMTYYPTGTVRSRYAGRNAFKSTIPLVDHPGFDITNKSVLLKKHATIIILVINPTSFSDLQIEGVG